MTAAAITAAPTHPVADALDRAAEWCAPVGVFRDATRSGTPEDGGTLRALAEALRAVPQAELEFRAGHYAKLAVSHDRTAAHYEDECDPEESEHDRKLLAGVPELRDQAERYRRLAHLFTLLAGGEA